MDSIFLQALAGDERDEALRALCDRFAARLERMELADILPSQRTVTAAVDQLPVTEGSLATVFDTGRSMFKAVARSVEYQRHAPADKAGLRNATFLPARAESLPFADASFDVVASRSAVSRSWQAWHTRRWRRTGSRRRS